MFALIQRLKHRLGLSHGQLLILAREVAEDASVYSLHQLTQDQREKLVLFMQDAGTRRIDTLRVIC